MILLLREVTMSGKISVFPMPVKAAAGAEGGRVH